MALSDRGEHFFQVMPSLVPFHMGFCIRNTFINLSLVQLVNSRLSFRSIYQDFE